MNLETTKLDPRGFIAYRKFSVMEHRVEPRVARGLNTSFHFYYSTG